MGVEVTISVLAGLTVGLTAVVKQIGMPSRFIPLTALFLGTGLSFLVAGQANVTDWRQIVLIGIIAGLMSVGLYSGTKNTIGKK